jgi:acyl carrier protein
MEHKIKQKIFDIIKQETNINISKLNSQINFLKQSFLDSLQFVSITARIEEELGIELPISIMEVTTLDEYLSIIAQQL